MKQTVTNHQFHRAFDGLQPEKFSPSGLDALFEYLEKLERTSGEELEFDVLAIWSGFREYESIERAAEAYGLTPEALADHTPAIEFGGGVIVQAFHREVRR